MPPVTPDIIFAVSSSFLSAALFIAQTTNPAAGSEELEILTKDLRLKLFAVDRTKTDTADIYFPNRRYNRKMHKAFPDYFELEAAFKSFITSIHTKGSDSQEPDFLVRIVDLWKKTQGTPLQGTGFERGILRMLLRHGFSTSRRYELLIKNEEKKNVEKERDRKE
jgi:hypothetical protein